MIALWMLYACVLGALLGGAALALERVAALRRLPTRGIWLGALVATCAVPVMLALVPRAAPTETDRSIVAPVASPSSEAGRVSVASVPRLGAGLSVRSLAVPVFVLWGSATTLLFGMLLHGVLMQRRARRRWGRTIVDGIPVLVAPDAGPAVVGVRRLHIVLPGWAIAGDPGALRLMLQHEEQHVRARDPNLLQFAAALLVLMPWNPALWWLVRRLRLAVELDCDRRVLGVGQDAHAYGTLLIDVGARYAAAVLLPGAAFSESSSHLARRIEAMTAPHPRRPLLRACGFGTVAAAAVALACTTPRPEPIRPAVSADRFFPPLEIHRPRVLLSQEYTREQMTAAIWRYYPEVLRGDTGTLPLRFVLAADGRVVSTSRGQPGQPSVPTSHVEHVLIQDAGAGYYGPARVRVEVTWLKPDSLLGESLPFPGVTVSTIESPDAESLGVRLERQVRNALSTRIELMRGLRSDDTAHIWLVFSTGGQLLRAGRADSAAALRQALDVPRESGYYRLYTRGEIAPWVVNVGAAWVSP